MAGVVPPRSEAISEPTLVEIYRYWHVKRGERLMPARSDLDPVELKSRLPQIFMVDVQHNPLAFRYRLIGTAIVELLGRDSTGRAVDEATYGKGEALNRLLQIFSMVVQIRRPVAYKGNIFYVAGREWRQVEILLMPLGADDATVEIIFAGYVSVGPVREPRTTTKPAGGKFLIIPDPVIRE